VPVALPVSAIQCDLPPESANATPGVGEPPKLAPPPAQPPCELELLKLAGPARLSTEALQLLAFAICDDKYHKVNRFQILSCLSKRLF
jgi:hypothetical protein